jgi:muramoyltetrapeptide carboxypeptidase LdcA involved in peptidoglycan recycling
VNGDLKADHVSVKITAPTLNTHLTSKIYVDTAISNVNVDTTNLSKLDQANTFTATNSFTDITTTSLINNNENIDDRDHFYYTNTGLVYNKRNGQALVWGTAIRGSYIFEGTSFKPKFYRVIYYFNSCILW